jgi:pSer/pThr/pTyr-binding forkhead associated (FHA) protein
MKAPPTINVQLIHIFGSMKGEIQEFTDNLISIGRTSASILRFPAEEPGVSRNHARIEREGNQFKLIDVSTYGTFVNGKQIKETFLKSGDVIEFGPGGPKVSFNTEVVEGVVAVSEVESPQQPPPSPVADAVPPRVVAQVESRQKVEVPEAVAPEQKPAPEKVVAPQYKVAAPLVIQYGPTIRSYNEVPVIVGAHARADFVLQAPGILDQHFQIFFARNVYWIKDLTGQQTIRINRQPIDVQAELKPQDEIECTSQGPCFKFLGDGRLAELEMVPSVPPGSANRATTGDVKNEDAAKSTGGNFFTKFFKKS